MMPLALKYATRTKRGKTCSRCQARENVQPVLSAAKRADDAKGGKTCKRCQRRENARKSSDDYFKFAPDWLRKQYVCSDWCTRVFFNQS